MEKTKFHMFMVATIIVLIVGFYILLSPPFKDLRIMIGLPADQPGARYNETVGAADIISGVSFDYNTGQLVYTQEGWESASVYLGRIAFVYHSVFITLMYATVILLANLYLNDRDKEIVMDGALIATLLVVVSALLYSYFDVRNFFWHGTFLVGLGLFWFIGAYMFLKFKPKTLLEWNIWLSGLLLLLGAAWGAWLGASFMYFRESFLEALIISRFNPDISEENIYWRALTSHEHAMVAIALALVFFVAMKVAGVDEEKKLFGFLSVKLLYIFALIGQFFMAVAAYAVTFFGKVAHLIITPAALLLILATLLLSLVVQKGILRWSLLIGNIIMWVGVAAEGAITAMNLRKALFLLPIPFRDPLYDWAELAYNIGHWHILMFSWGIILLIIYLVYPVDFTEEYKFITWIIWITLIGYSIASIGINFYMLANPPAEYTPNPYNNIWLTFLVEPFLGLVSLGVAVAYLLYLYKYGLDALKHIINAIANYFKNLL